jgi:hypothetical protein
MKDDVRNINDARMLRRAPNGPLPFSESDANYIAETLRGMEQAFGLAPFVKVAKGQWPARRLLAAMIDWWRTIQPTTDAERSAYGRLLGTIRLIDLAAIMADELDHGRRSR